MGITEIRNIKEFSATNIVYGRSLSMDSYENMCSMSYIKKEPSSERVSQLPRLLSRET